MWGPPQRKVGFMVEETKTRQDSVEIETSLDQTKADQQKYGVEDSKLNGECVIHVLHNESENLIMNE